MPIRYGTPLILAGLALICAVLFLIAAVCSLDTKFSIKEIPDNGK
jgi:hypothetical protein